MFKYISFTTNAHKKCTFRFALFKTSSKLYLQTANFESFHTKNEFYLRGKMALSQKWKKDNAVLCYKLTSIN